MFVANRKQLAQPGQTFSPDGLTRADSIPESPSLQDCVERQLSSERHRAELTEYATRNRELERRLSEATGPPPASPDGNADHEPEPEPELEDGAFSVLDQAKACIRRGDEHLSSYETEAAVEEYDAGLQLLGVQIPIDASMNASGGGERHRETVPLFDSVPAQDEDVPLFESVPPQDADSPAATPLDAALPAVAAVRAELEEKRNKAKELLRRKEDEFKVRMLLDKGRERMKSQQYSSALTAFREGLRCCSDQPHGIFRDIREELRAQEAEAVAACNEQMQFRREERQRLQEATKSGWLQKKGDKFKNFKRRWFILECSKSPGDPGGSRIQ